MRLPDDVRAVLKNAVEVEIQKREQIERMAEKAENRLIDFIEMFWHILEPKKPFVNGWVLGAICEHLTAVTDGEINRLLINVPPGFTKSLTTDVFWPAWEWGPEAMPTMRYVAFSYSAHLTLRDNGKFRRLILAPEYQAAWGSRFTVDRHSQIKIENDKTGFKLATSIGGVGTGERGDRVIIDDANNVKKAESKVVMEETAQWTTEVMPDRINDPTESAIIGIQQRTGEGDFSGTLLRVTEGEYCHLCIPNEYDPRRFYINQINWMDPREDEGELAWPDRLNQEETVKMKRIKGSFAYAGQYQQSPAPRGGGIIKRDDWQLWPIGGEKFDDFGKPQRKLEYPLFDYIIVSVDTAMTEDEENDWSACTVWGTWRNEAGVMKIMLMDAWQDRLTFTPLIQKIVKTCRERQCDRLLVENKANGHNVVQEIRRMVSEEEFGIQLIEPRELGDKENRAYAVQHLFENGVIYAPEREWAEMVISQCETFPKGEFNDLVDTTTQALNYLRKIGELKYIEEETVYDDYIPHAERHPEAPYDV